MWRDGLSPRQIEILRVIEQWMAQHGFSPTIREIGQACGIRSPNGVVCHLEVLEKKGLLHRAKTKSRAIELSAGYLNQVRGLPLLTNPLREPLQTALQAAQRLPVDLWFPQEGSFVWQIQDDSWAGQQIRRGDYLIVRLAAGTDSGQIVLTCDDAGQLQLQFWPVADGQVLGLVSGLYRPTC